jgi:hypothetical protein
MNANYVHTRAIYFLYPGVDEHNFLRYLPIVRENIGVFLKNNHFCKKCSILSKKVNFSKFLAEFENIKSQTHQKNPLKYIFLNYAKTKFDSKMGGQVFFVDVKSVH